MKVKVAKNSNFITLSNKSGILVWVETTNLYLKEEEQTEYRADSELTGNWTSDLQYVRKD